MNGPGVATPTNVTYVILWVSCTNGLNEATEGRIEIASISNGRKIGSSSKAVEGKGGAEAGQEDLISFSTDGSTEKTDMTSITSKKSTQAIPCSAKLTWGAWEATFDGSYNPSSGSYRSTKSAPFDFNFRGMDERMETGLKGHTITRLGINCPERDDHGHEIFVFHMVWKQSPQESREARLFAKRVPGKASLHFSKDELRELGVPKQHSSNRRLRQPHVPTKPSKPDYRERHRKNNARRGGRIGKTGFMDGTRGGGRGNMRGTAMGRVRPVKRPSHRKNATRRDGRMGTTGFRNGARGVGRGNMRGRGRAMGRVRPVKKPSHKLTWDVWWRMNK